MELDRVTSCYALTWWLFEGNKDDDNSNQSSCCQQGLPLVLIWDHSLHQSLPKVTKARLMSSNLMNW